MYYFKCKKCGFVRSVKNSLSSLSCPNCDEFENADTTDESKFISQQTLIAKRVAKGERQLAHLIKIGT